MLDCSLSKISITKFGSISLCTLLIYLISSGDIIQLDIEFKNIFEFLGAFPWLICWWNDFKDSIQVRCSILYSLEDALAILSNSKGDFNTVD